MECPKCGIANRDDAENCRMCGTYIGPKLSPTGPKKACPFCKAINEPDAIFCVSCNKPFGEQKGLNVDAIFSRGRVGKSYDRTYADAPGSAAREARLGTAGIILLMISLWALLDILFTTGIIYSEAQSSDYDRLKDQYPQLKTLIADLAVCETIRVVFLVIAFVGAITSIRRLNFMLAMLGAIFGLLLTMTSILAFAWGIWLLITAVLFFGAIIAVMLIAFSRREFMLA